MVEREIRERDILVASNEYAYVQDLTKGDIILYVGPTKISLSNTERMVEYDETERFVPLGAEDGSGVKPFMVASSSQYVILENPARPTSAQPTRGPNASAELVVGKRVVIPGPITFPLWPGQRARTIDGHQLREDQYLLVRVYDAVDGAEESHIGGQRIIRGSDAKFYIPRTGLEVVPDDDGFVRNAVKLLDGQFCILLSPNGKKRYCRGPQVVFPEPMEEFVDVQGSRIFQAYHVKRDTGLHVRVLRDFVLEQDDQVSAGSYSAGQEIFVQNREGFFYPTENLEVLKVVKAIPLAEKEGIYVREIATGRVTTEIGPKNYLADTTKVEVISRTLSPELATLYNVTGHHDPWKAIAVYIPPTYAVLVTAKDRRDVVLGPNTRILGFDEDLEILRLSTGKPKTDEHLLATCFLQVRGNKVSDVVRVRTKDHVELDVTLSYRVSFVEKAAGDKERWFDVKNYVALLCEHLGSIVRATIRATGIEHFHVNSTEIIRSAILGEKKEHEKRPGRSFEENNMWVYDVEVLDVRILDDEVKCILSDAQREAIKHEIHKRNEELHLEDARFQEHVNRQIFESRIATSEAERQLEASRQELTKLRTRVEVELDELIRLGKAHNEAKSHAVIANARLATAKQEQTLKSELRATEVEAFRQQMTCIQPELVTVLKSIADRQFTAEVSKNLSPLAILGGESVSDVLARLLRSMPMGFAPSAGAAGDGDLEDPVTGAR